MKLSKKERLFTLIIFLTAFTYVVARALSVFYVHDELVSKWSYMIDWNFLPFSGYFDANNHLLNSFLGGLFIRTFQSDHIFVVRLGNVLAFPLFFYAIFSLRKFFQSKAIFFALLISLVFSAYLIEFFSLARGYGLSWAFLLFGISQQMLYFQDKSYPRLILSLFGFLLAVSANLALLAIVAFGALLFLFKFGKRFFQWLIYVSFLAAFGYLINYALALQRSGKFYLGSEEGFLKTSLQPLIENNYGAAVSFLTIAFIIGSILLLIQLFHLHYLTKNWKPKISLQFHYYLIAAIGSMILMNFFLGVNYPENRAAAHLLIFFLLALFFGLDLQHLKKTSVLIGFLAILAFTWKANFEYSIEWDYEHFDEELLTSIPEKLNGVPPTTGGRFWQIDNELSRAHHFPLRAFQDMSLYRDSLQDYIIVLPDLNPTIYQSHQLIYRDSISDLSLFKRKEILNKKKLAQYERNGQMKEEHEYFEIFTDTLSGPLVIRTQGTIMDLNINRDFILIFSAEELGNNEKLEYGGIAPISSAPINEAGNIEFDFSYLVEGRKEPYLLKYYLWKKDKLGLEVDLSVETYQLH